MIVKHGNGRRVCREDGGAEVPHRATARETSVNPMNPMEHTQITTAANKEAS